MHSSYTVRQLSGEEIVRIYNTCLPGHFPADERKPVSMIERMLSEEGYEGLGIFAKEKLMGYAFLVKAPEKKTLLLDYLAVLKEYRSSGVGNAFLTHMKELYGQKEGIIIETERPDMAVNEEQRRLRLRRNGFYERNGCRQTPITINVAGVDYGVFYLATGKQLPDEKVAENLAGIYDYMLGEKYNRAFCFT